MCLLMPDAAGASATGGTLTCDVTSVMLMGSGNGSFSGPDRAASTQLRPEPRGGHGRHLRLTVTGANGCTSRPAPWCALDLPGASDRHPHL